MRTVNVLEAACLEGVSRVFFPSSGTVYLGSLGEGVKKIDENIPLNPPSVYAATKAGPEFLRRTYAKAFYLRSVKAVVLTGNGTPKLSRQEKLRFFVFALTAGMSRRKGLTSTRGGR